MVITCGVMSPMVQCQRMAHSEGEVAATEVLRQATPGLNTPMTIRLDTI